MQGVLFVLNEGGSGEDFYDTPTSTGPVRIVAEANGVLTLKSIKGPYIARGVEIDVKTPGGQTYFFNLRTRKFQ